jgi:uncharacterized membrane protein YoaK (UPF0700 family)
VFLLFVALTRLLILRWERAGRPPLRYSLLLQLVLLLLCVGCARLASPILIADEPLVLLTGMLCAAAMAVQNAYGKLLLGKVAATTVMTGNVTQLVIELVDSARGDPSASDRFKKLLWPVITFAVGSIAGAFAFVWTGFYGLLLPCLILAVLAWLDRDR